MDNRLDNQSPFELEEKSNKVFAFIPKYGLFAGLAMIISFLLFIILYLQYHQWTGYIASLFGFAIAFFGVKQFRTEISPKGYITFGQGFKAGFLIYLIGGLISMAFYFLYTLVIDTSFMSGLISFTKDKMAEQGLNRDQINASMAYTQKFFQPQWMAIISLIFNIIFSAICGLLIGMICKRDL